MYIYVVLWQNASALHAHLISLLVSFAIQLGYHIWSHIHVLHTSVSGQFLTYFFVSVHVHVHILFITVITRGLAVCLPVDYTCGNSRTIMHSSPMLIKGLAAGIFFVTHSTGYKKSNSALVLLFRLTIT